VSATFTPVVPAKAGTHNHRPSCLARRPPRWPIARTRGMGPGSALARASLARRGLACPGRQRLQIQHVKKPEGICVRILAAPIVPELLKRTTLLENRGRRECRVRASPMARLQAKNAGGSYHRFSQIIRHSLRDGFNAYGALSPETGLSCLRHHAARHRAT
jgi:hypothetical protein